MFFISSFSLSSLSVSLEDTIPVCEYHTEIERRYDHSFHSLPSYQRWIQLLLSLKFSGPVRKNILSFDNWFGLGRSTGMVAGVRACSAFLWKSGATLAAGKDRCQGSLSLQSLLDPLVACSWLVWQSPVLCSRLNSHGKGFTTRWYSWSLWTQRGLWFEGKKEFSVLSDFFTL